MSAVSFGSGIAANIATVVIVGAAWLCKNKFKHTKSSCHTKWFDCSSQEDSAQTLRDDVRLEIMEELRRDGIIPEEV